MTSTERLAFFYLNPGRT